ncbi:MAG: acyl-CoA thioesterase [Acidobacteriota bacterium]
MKDHEHKSDFEVRDYECDMQGVVNNSVYQNYLEHARHLYLKDFGIDFAEFTRRNIILTVIRVELDYKAPLVSGDKFRIETTVERVSPLRIAFIQNILRYPDNKLILRGKVFGTALNERRRPEIPEELEELMKKNGK